MEKENEISTVLIIDRVDESVVLLIQLETNFVTYILLDFFGVFLDRFFCLVLRLFIEVLLV